MEFMPHLTHEFEKIFEASSQAIRNMPGCLYLSLHRDHDNPAVFYTLSKWNSAGDLEAYRNSPLFERTWKATKALFSGKPMAWSLKPEIEIP